MRGESGNKGKISTRRWYERVSNQQSNQSQALYTFLYLPDYNRRLRIYTESADLSSQLKQEKRSRA